MSIDKLRDKWVENSEDYKTKEVGSGVHSFISDVLEADMFFKLRKTAAKSNAGHTFVHDTESIKAGRPDFILYINKEVEIPVEAKCHGHIDKGIAQLFRYQIGLGKQFGILTDGNEWRFYRGSNYKRIMLADMLERQNDFQLFWQDYIKPENYYIELFNKSGQQDLFESKIDLNEPDNRKLFFDDTTRLVEGFKVKMKSLGIWELDFDRRIEKTAVETSYAYLIQFILYKVLVDNCYGGLREEYDRMMQRMSKYIKDEDFYTPIMREVREIAEYISQDIYKPFKVEQESITEKLFKQIKNPTIDEIAPWLDIIAYINKYNFANLRNEIFGFVYENYLKDLYQDKNKGQYFTDPAVVNFMLEEIGYNPGTLAADQGNISIIDPSCGAGTFLYGAVDKIITALNDDTLQTSKRIEDLIDQNIFGLDIDEFPLYLAEMSILMRLLPLIVNDKFKNPINNKFKIFKTKDSIAEFLDVGINSKEEDSIDLFSHLEATALDYPSFMRDEKDLEEMMQSLRMRMGRRKRFDYVIGNPPYIGYNRCGGFDFAKKIKDAKNKAIFMNNVYGVNLNTVPGRRKPYPPKPNLYAFFIALGLALLKDGGKICYIIPQTVLTAGDLDVLRYHLSKHTTIETIVTFDGNLFVGRGLKQKKPVPTSSLIFVAKKSSPRPGHKVRIINYGTYAESQAGDFGKYLNSRNRDTRDILQSSLLEQVENWNFIRQSAILQTLAEKYAQHTLSIEEWRRLVLSDYDEFHFDVGYELAPELYTNIKTGNYPMVDFARAQGYTKMDFSQYYPKDNQKIALTRNSRHSTLGHGYNIIWRIKNFQRFMLIREPVIFNMGQAAIIATDNKNEALFLLSLLNSPLNHSILKWNLKSENEKEFLVALKSIKQYIRIPKITSANQSAKDEIIKRTDEMLAMEKGKLRDIINLSHVQMQKFSNVSVAGNKLVLESTSGDISVSIPPGKVALVQSLFPDKKLLGDPIRLSDLKNMDAIDFAQQRAAKDYIDDLVFAMYFNIPVKTIALSHAADIKAACQRNEFYAHIQDPK